MQSGTQKGCSAGAVPYMGPLFFFFPLRCSKGGEAPIIFFWTVDAQAQILALVEGLALLAVIVGDMIICIAPFATLL
jgi:hypothetical protein